MAGNLFSPVTLGSVLAQLKSSIVASCQAKPAEVLVKISLIDWLMFIARCTLVVSHCGWDCDVLPESFVEHLMHRLEDLVLPAWVR